MFHVFDNVMYLFDCQNLCITMCCMFFLHLSHFGPAALRYIINNILSYRNLFYLIRRFHPYELLKIVKNHLTGVLEKKATQ